MLTCRVVESFEKNRFINLLCFRLTLDNLTAEAKQLEGNIRQLKNKVEKSGDDIKQYFAEFIKVSLFEGKSNEKTTF